MANVAVTSQIERQTMNPSRKTATNWLFAVFGSIFITSSLAFAQGISLDKSDEDNLIKAKKERFVLKSDKLMGAVVVDTRTGLEYMRCLVGQTYKESESSVQNTCSGNPQYLTLDQVAVVQKKAGSGWRLPSTNEYREILSRTPDYVNQIFITGRPRDRFTGDFEPNEAFWTSTKCGNSIAPNVIVGTVGMNTWSDFDPRYSLSNDPKAYCTNPDRPFAVRFVRNRTK